MVSDETRWRRYLDGDESGLIELMDQYGNSLTFYINAYLHDVNDAEDLMIEAFAYLTIKKPCIREGCFKAYLYKSARNLALRYVTKRRREYCFSFEDLGLDPESKILTEELVQTEERNQILYQCMEQLNPAYREALFLVYFENMRHAEAAHVMKKSERQVADLVYRARKKLRTHLESEGFSYAEY